jgi:hypothetical protein
MHVLPQPPQLFESFVVFTHAPLHVVGTPAGHAHVPLLQFPPNGHCTPHMPQFAESLVLSVHTPLQLSGNGVVQLRTHWPPLHTVPAPQTIPHIPQLFGSV